MLKNKRHYKAGSKFNEPKFSFTIIVFWNNVKSSKTYRFMWQKMLQNGKRDINQNCTLQGMWYSY